MVLRLALGLVVVACLFKLNAVNGQMWKKRGQDGKDTEKSWKIKKLRCHTMVQRILTISAMDLQFGSQHRFCLKNGTTFCQHNTSYLLYSIIILIIFNTLPETNSSPLKMMIFNRLTPFPGAPISGDMLISERVNIITIQITRLWFQIFFIFTPIWGNDPIWLILLLLNHNHHNLIHNHHHNHNRYDT